VSQYQFIVVIASCCLVLKERKREMSERELFDTASERVRGLSEVSRAAAAAGVRGRSVNRNESNYFEIK
jgi:hypothetical protein